MTSAIFQSDGKVEVPSEQLIIPVIGPSTQFRTSSLRPLLRMQAWRDERLSEVPFEERF